MLSMCCDCFDICLCLGVMGLMLSCAWDILEYVDYDLGFLVK